MNPLTLLPAALAAFGGYRGYKAAKQQGASGLGSLARGALGAYTGYQLGSMVPGARPTGPQIPGLAAGPGDAGVAEAVAAADRANKTPSGFGLDSILNVLKKPDGSYDPVKVSAAIAGSTYLAGAFDPAPVDVYQPTYNLAYGEFAKQRPGYTYIDPTTGAEKEYAPVYIPEQDPANQGTMRMGPYAMEKTRLKTGGLAEVKKFNEGGVNYLPSKVSHDENDSNNYVRAQGYVEDGSGAGDKDEDTMLAQLADGEFVTRADGVLGAGIIAGANPNSFKDMREKGATYFYEQQKRYKRVFDLLKENDGNSKKN